MRPLRPLPCCFALVSGLACLAPSAAHAAGPQWYVELLPTDETPGLASGLLDAAKKDLHDEFAGRPEWAVDLADVPAATGDAAADAKKLVDWLKQKKLIGYSLHARILEVDQAVNPAPAGKTSKVLEVTVKVTLVGAGIPDGKLAIGGDGESTVDAEIGAAATPADVADAKSDALADAIKGAVDDATARLTAAQAPAPPKKPAKGK